MTDYSNILLYGKNPLDRVVSIEVHDDQAEVFRELSDGTIETSLIPNRFWILSDKKHGKGWIRLQGNQHYSWGKQFTTKSEFQRHNAFLKKSDTFCVWNSVEALMIKDGITFLKGMDIKDISILSFDIETTGLKANKNSLLLISNTFRRGDFIERKLFSFDDYPSRGEMLLDWAKWVCEKNPSIMCGHNINSFDIPHLIQVADFNDVSICIGRDGSELKLSQKESKFRVDGSRDLHYHKPVIYGRQVIDTMFLSYRYDIATKKYESYGLKQIIKQEGLEKEDRVFYDASKIRENYMIPEEMKKIKEYCIHDSDDALSLFDLMIPPFFYMTQMIPKPFQMVIESASGSQINAMMCRAYLQDKHGLPKATDAVAFEGSISSGIPGIYSNCLKIDVASMFPSIQIQYQIYPKHKDPNGMILKFLTSLRDLRLFHKKLYKETGDKFHDHQQNTFKILINSTFGFLGATGLNFNYPEGAAEITRRGREIISKTILWATNKDVSYWLQKAGKCQDNQNQDEEKIIV